MCVLHVYIQINSCNDNVSEQMRKRRREGGREGGERERERERERVFISSINFSCIYTLLAVLEFRIYLSSSNMERKR